MRFIPFPQVNAIINKDTPPLKEYAAHCSEDGYVTALAQLTWKERWRIFRTGKLWVIRVTAGYPPQPTNLVTENPLVPRETEKKTGKA